MKQYSRRSLALTCWLIVMTLALVLWPRPSNAAQAVVVLADSNQRWGDGRFFRTGLAAATVGGVQLVPTQLLKTWQTASSLPYGLSQHTSTVYRGRIFVLGGNTLIDQQLTKTNAFFATRMIPGQFGQLEPWLGQTSSTGGTTLPPLPIRVSDAASVVVEVGGKPYLFVLGGQLGEGNLDDVTTDDIYSYEIRENNNGQLISQTWRPSTTSLPHEPNYEGVSGGRGGGARNLAAATVTIAGEPYIYIFGGWNRTYLVGSYFDEYFSTVYRSKVTAGNTGPVLGAWEAVGDIRGFYNGSVQNVALAGASTVMRTDLDTQTTAVYLIGGTNQDNTYDANAYIAKIDLSNPATPLAWLNSGNMSETRVGHDAVQAKGNITVSGGSTNGDAPTTSLARGLIEENLELYRPEQNAANFDLTEGALTQARMYHTMETLRDEGNRLIENRQVPFLEDYAYIIGGKIQINQDTQDPASQQVLFGDLDQPPIPTDSFVAEGKYFSKIFDFGQDAEYFNLKWQTILHPGEVIEMQYRTGDDRQNLSLPVTLTATPVPVAGKPDTYIQTFTFNPVPKARYFQFIATLKSSPTNRKVSPILDNVSLDVKRVGFPNVRFSPQNLPFFAPNPIDSNTTAITPVVSLVNKAFDANHPALDADWDGPGFFSVDIYVRRPNTPQTPPSFGEIGTAYAWVNKAVMKADMRDPFTIASKEWYPGSCPSNCQTINWRTIFNTSGTYTVYVMVDSNPATVFGNIVESETATTFGETDNLFGPFTVTVQEIVDLRIFVPMSMTPPATGVTTQAAPVLPRRQPPTIGDSH